MTSHFDHLMELYSATEDNEFPVEALKLIYEEAVRELDKVDPKKITWENWLRLDGVYQRLYKVGKMSLIETQKSFIDDCHTVLDHNGGYHLQCFSVDFLSMMGYVDDVRRHGLDETKYKGYYPSQAGSETKWKRIRAKYQPILTALKEYYSKTEEGRPIRGDCF